MDRALFTGGPAYLVFNGVTFQMEDDWKVDLDLKDFEVKTNLQGTVGKAIQDTTAKITFTPLAFGATLATLFATLFPYQPDMRGQLIFPTDDLPVVIQTAAGQSITFQAGALTKMPEITFSPEKVFFGSVEITCLIANNTAPSASDAFFTIADSAYVEPSLNPLDILFDLYTVVSGLSDSAPFTGIETDENGVKFAPKVKLTDRKTASLGVYNKMIDDVTADVTFMPENVSETDWATLIKTQGTGYGRGQLREQFGAILQVIGSASGKARLTIPLAVGNKGGLFFGQKSRTSEVTLEAGRSLTSQALTTTTATTSTTVSMTSTTGLNVGMMVSGTGIAAGTTVKTVKDGTHLVLSAEPTSGGTPSLTYRNPLFALDVVP
jgi:hypothetical protein